MVVTDPAQLRRQQPSRDQDQEQVHLPGPPRVFLSVDMVNTRDYCWDLLLKQPLTFCPASEQILTDVPEVDDQPRHQRQILILKDEQMLVKSAPMGPHPPEDLLGIWL